MKTFFYEIGNVQSKEFESLKDAIVHAIRKDCISVVIFYARYRTQFIISNVPDIEDERVDEKVIKEYLRFYHVGKQFKSLI